MSEFVWFGDTQGSGYITASKDELTVKPIGCRVVDEDLAPGAMTDMSGMFCRPLEYMGQLGENEMIFYIGEDSDLLTTKHYFQSVLWLSEKRIAESFAPNSGRDFHYINGVWK